MNVDLQLKVQAWVDGELPERDAQGVAEMIAADPAARALAAELRMTRALLAGNEPEVAVPVSREFYWSKIQRAIERAEREELASEPEPWWLAWRRFLAPAAGVALAAMFTWVGLHTLLPAAGEDAHLADVENLSEHTDSYAFSSKSENMFVVWIENRAAQAPAADSDEDDGSVVQ